MFTIDLNKQENVRFTLYPLIKNSINISNKFLVATYQETDAILICPDAGASKKIGKYF